MSHSSLVKFLYTLNAARQGYFKSIRVRHSKIVFIIIKILDEYGVIRGYRIDKELDTIKIYLKYRSGFTMVFDIKQISKERKRVYVNLLELYKLKNKFGKTFYILSTPKGILSDDECIRNKTGGEVLCKIVL
jgi:small subunit ribosomal protein S8